MSRVDELIAALCPDGVEYRDLGEVSFYSTDRIGSNLLTSENYVGVDNLLAEKKGKTISNYVPTSGQLTMFRKGDILLGNIRPYLKKIWLSSHDGGTNGDVLVICIKDQKTISPAYLYYVLSSNQFFAYDMQNSKGAKMPRGDKRSIMKYSIPIPPLPIQQEIVRILDAFTTLEAELEAELEARKKQYEYYRDELLSFGDDVEWKTFGDISSIVRGASPRPIQKFITNDETGVNWIKIGDVRPGSKYITSTKDKVSQEGASKSRFVRSGDFLLSNSMSFGRPYIMKTEGCIHDGWLSISGFEKTFSSDFLYHLLSSSLIQKTMAQRASNGTVQNLNADIVNSLELPVPSIEEQARIVEILDRFDALTNDITQGLPAELAARRKQYEYYRDKLLSFKEKVS